MDLEKLEFKDFPFEVKGAATDGSTFEGLNSVFYNIDTYGDIVDDAAWDQDLAYFLEEGFIGGLNHDFDNPIGNPLPGTKVTPQGLFLRGSVIDTAHGMDVRKMLKAKVVRKLSFAYETLGRQMLETPEDVMSYWKGKGYSPSPQDLSRAAYGNIRLLTRVRAIESSPVTLPANNLATISAVKAAAKVFQIDFPAARPLRPDVDEEEKAPSGSTSLPIGPREHAWDSGAAEKRIRSWAGADEAPNAKMRKAYFWYDAENADQFGSYKLPFADVLNGTLTAIPRAIFACAGVMQGARGGVDIPESDMAGVKAKIARYYARMRDMFDDPGMMPPWEDMPMNSDSGKSVPTDARGIEKHLREAGGFSQAQAKEIISNIKALQRDAVSDETPAPDPETPPAPDPPPADETPAPEAKVQIVGLPEILTREDAPETEDSLRLRAYRQTVAEKLYRTLQNIGAN